MNDATNPTQRAYERIKEAILDVPADDATQADVANAVLLLGSELALPVVGEVGLARFFMDLAERHMKARGETKVQPAPGASSPETGKMHAAFDAAAKLLLQDGIEPHRVCEGMLSFAVGWIVNCTSREEAAGVLYQQADALASRKPTQH